MSILGWIVFYIWYLLAVVGLYKVVRWAIQFVFWCHKTYWHHDWVSDPQITTLHCTHCSKKIHYRKGTYDEVEKL